MKKIHIFTLFILFYVSNISAQQAGVLDSTFSKIGYATLEFFNSTDDAFGITMQPADNKIIVTGYTMNGIELRIASARYHSNGSLDSSFGTNGKFMLQPRAGNSYSGSVQVQKDGKIVIAGHAESGSSTHKYDFMVFRLKSNGRLDSSFGMNGISYADFGTNSSAWTMSMKIQSNGKILLGGYIDSTKSRFAFARFNSNGSLDNTFNQDGKYAFPVAHLGTQMLSVEQQSDGKIIGAGLGSNSAILVRLDSNGIPDNSFGIAGTTAYKNGTKVTIAKDIKVLPDDKIIVAGNVRTGGYIDALMARFNSNGSIDNTFGASGSRIYSYSSSDDEFTCTEVFSDGKIICAGYKVISGSEDIIAAKFNSNGDPDSTFGQNGVFSKSLSAGNDRVNSIAIQGDQKPVISGWASGNNGTDFLVARILNTPKTNGILEISGLPFELNIYPNPAYETINLHFGFVKPIESLNIQIYDRMGKNVMDLPVIPGSIINKMNLAIDIRKLPAGLYYVKTIMNKYCQTQSWMKL